MFVAENLPSSSKDSNGTETPLARMLNRIRTSEDFPSISKYVAEINQKLAANPDHSDASELANVILNDYALTSKLLKLANSVTYGFAAGKVTTITRAVVVLGYEYVRMAAISLCLLEHLKCRSNAADLKEELICSLWSGMIAREFALKEADVDPEEAFVTAMLSRFGKLVMIRYLPNEYRKITNWMKDHKGSETKAVKSACGVTYEMLGIAVAKLWNFPQKICDGLQPLTKNDLKNTAKSPSKLLIVTNFVKELGKLIRNDALRGNDQPIQDLLDLYNSKITLSRREVKKLVKASVEKVERHVEAMDFDLTDSVFFAHLSGTPKAQEGLPTGKDGALSQFPASFQLSDATAQKADGDRQRAVDPVDLIMDGIQEISQAMMAEHNVNDIALMSLEILYRSLGFQRALMFIRDSMSQMMTVRFGYGRKNQRLVRNVGFTVEDAKDLFNLSVQVGKDLIVADAYDEKISHLIPKWYRSHIDAPAFIFLPVIIQNVAIGALYADRNESGQPITDTEHRHLSMLRNQLVLAIRYRQGSK